MGIRRGQPRPKQRTRPVARRGARTESRAMKAPRLVAVPCRRMIVVPMARSGWGDLVPWVGGEDGGAGAGAGEGTGAGAGTGAGEGAGTATSSGPKTLALQIEKPHSVARRRPAIRT